MENEIVVQLRMMGIAHWSLVDKHLARGSAADTAWDTYALREQVCRYRARMAIRKKSVEETTCLPERPPHPGAGN